jgi:hypothetical protein
MDLSGLVFVDRRAASIDSINRKAEFRCDIAHITYCESWRTVVSSPVHIHEQLIEG